jgi:hypothetical protein
MNIPNDWTNFSDKESQEYINYLRKNIRKCKISQIDIDGGVKISRVYKRFDISDSMWGYHCGIKINNKRFYKNDSSVFFDALDLFLKAEKKVKILSKVKITDWWLDHKYDLKILAILATYIFAVGGIVFLGYNVSKKK